MSALKLSIVLQLILMLPGTLNVVSANTTPIDAYGKTLDLYIHSIVVDTTSDWIRVDLRNVPAFVVYRVELVEGAGLDGLRFNANPTLITINKKEFDQSRVVLRLDIIAINSSRAGWITVSKGDIGYVSISLYSWSNGSLDMYWHHNISGPLREPLTLPVNYDGIYASVDGVGYYERLPKSLDRVVYAFYYPWYGMPSISGDWIHWEVSDGTAVNVAGTPLLGFYDSSDARLLRAHIILASSNGIDAFIASWWGIESFEDRCFSRLVEIAGEYGFNVSVYYESYRPWDPLTIDDIVEELVYIVERYSGYSAYLKVDGKPVIFIYNVEAHERPPEFWLEVRRRVEERVGRVYLVGDTRSPAYLHVFDGFHVYIDLDRDSMRRTYTFYREYMSLGLSGYDYETAIRKLMEGGPVLIQEKALFYTVIPGYDDTRIREPGKILPRYYGETYSRYWLDALTLNATRILITSWNELHEGTHIEPTIEYGFEYLSLTRKYASYIKDLDVRHTNLPLLDENITETSDGYIITITNKGSSPAIAVKVSIGGGSVMPDTVYRQHGSSTGSTLVIPVILPGESYRVKVNGDRVPWVSMAYYSVYGDRLNLARELHVNKPSYKHVTIQNETISTTDSRELIWKSLIYPIAVAVILTVALLALLVRRANPAR